MTVDRLAVYDDTLPDECSRSRESNLRPLLLVLDDPPRLRLVTPSPHKFDPP